MRIFTRVVLKAQKIVADEKKTFYFNDTPYSREGEYYQPFNNARQGHQKSSEKNSASVQHIFFGKVTNDNIFKECLGTVGVKTFFYFVHI